MSHAFISMKLLKLMILLSFEIYEVLHSMVIALHNELLVLLSLFLCYDDSHSRTNVSKGEMM